MATRTLGARVKIDGEKEYKEAISAMNQGNKVLASEMKKLQAEFAGNTDSMEFMTKKGDLLQRQLADQKEKVETLKQALANSAKQSGESSKATMEWQKSLNNAEAELYNLEHAIEENNAAMENQGEKMVDLGDTVDTLADKFGVKLPKGAKDALSGMQGFSAGTVAAMAAAAAAIAAVVKVVSDLGKLTLEVAAQVDEYITQSAIIGVPTQMLQAWDYAAPLIDVDAETIKGSMTKITRAMGDAASGSESAQAMFDALGVSITNSDGSLRSAEEVFYDVVDALGRMGEGAERDSIAMELMGKSAQELNPLINQGSKALKEYAAEAENAGYILDTEQIKKLGEVDDAYQKLQLTIEANRKQLAADFAPAAKEAMELFTDVVKKAGEMLKQSGLIENLASIIESLISIMRTAGDILKGIPGFNQGLSMIKSVLGGIAQFCALIADTADVIAGIFTLDFNRIGNAMGFGKSSGTLSHWQSTYMQQEGTLAQYQEYHANKRGESTYDGLGYDNATGQYYDIRTGNYVYGHNASGTDYWRGGLTWVGEEGPELVSLPRGSQVYDAQESKEFGSVYIDKVVIEASYIKELNDVVKIFSDAKVKARMG